MNGFVLSFDIGTSSVKAAAVAEDGTLLSAAVEPLTLYTPAPGRFEQDPDELWEASVRAARQITAREGGRVLGIAFGTYWKGIIPVDRAGTVLHRNLLWCDGRGVEEAAALNEALHVRCFNGAAYWPKLFWLKNHLPDIYEKAACLHEAGSYLKYRACGALASDYNNNYIRTTEPQLQEVYDRILAQDPLDRGKFAPLVMPWDRVGEVTRKAAEELGVPAGTPVFGGTTDVASVATGAGCALPGLGHVYMGTSGWIGAAVPTDPAYPFFMPYYPGTSLALAGIRSAGSTFSWALRRYYADADPQSVYRTAEAEVSRVPAGSGGLLALHWANTARAAQHPDAPFTVLNAGPDTGRAEILAAVMETIALDLRRARGYVNSGGFSPFPLIGKVLLPDSGYLAARAPASFGVLRAVGGCANSPSWMQRLADVLDTPVEVPKAPQHAAAVGVACTALIGLGIFSSLADVSRSVRTSRRFEPSPKHAALYTELYERRKEAEKLQLP